MIQCTRQHTVTSDIGFFRKNFNKKCRPMAGCRLLQKLLEAISKPELGAFDFYILIFFLAIPLIGPDRFILVFG